MLHKTLSRIQGACEKTKRLHEKSRQRETVHSADLDGKAI